MTEHQSCSVGPPYERLGRPLQICILLTLLALTRWPLSTRWLFYFDNINFALALTHFNPALHQPQPPGYPLFVGLMRVIYVFVREPNKVELISGLVGSGAALVLI